MTLIASTFSQEMPFIIGDLLFSSKEGKPNFITPTQLPAPERTQGYNPEYLPYELWQKIYILRDNLALSMAGDYYEMKVFLRELKLRIAAYDVLTKEIIENFLIDFDLKKNFSESVMMILLMTDVNEETRYVNRFTSGKWDQQDDEHFGRIWASGSGAESFLLQFSAPVTFTADSPRGSASHAVTANMGLLAKWLAIEKSSGITLRDHWGAGFEMIFFDGVRFAKFQEIAFVIFEGRSDENGYTNAAFPTVVIYLYYENDILFITSLKPEPGNWSVINDNVTYFSESVETTLFAITPLDLPAGTAIYAKQDLSFEARTIAAGYSILNHEQGLFNPSYFIRDSSVTVKFVHRKGLEVAVPTEINEQILKGAKAAFDFEREQQK